MKKIYLILSLLFVVCSIQSQVTISGTNYTTLAGAFHAVNSGEKTGDIIIEITGNTNELYYPTLIRSGAVWATYGTANYTSILIRPSGGGARTINMAGNLSMEIRNAMNLTIDGQNFAGNSLTIKSDNYAAVALVGTSNCVITNCTLKGSGRNVIGISVGSYNPNNNSITNCTIGASSGVPGYGIEVYTNGGIINNTTISNNNISGFNFPEGSTAGIFIDGAVKGFNVSGNRIFQSDAQSNSMMYGIRADCDLSTVSNTIEGNRIGYANAQGTGYCISNGSIYGIYYNADTQGARSYINGNVIAGIQSTSTQATSSFTGIYIRKGFVDVYYNTVGSLTATNAIVVNYAEGSHVRGIYNFGDYPMTTPNGNTLLQNIVGGIAVSGCLQTVVGIEIATPWRPVICLQNIVGGTVANSILSTSSCARVTGIRFENRYGGLVENTIQNITGMRASNLDASPNVEGVAGIDFQGYSTGEDLQYVRENTIKNLNNANPTGKTITAGILHSSSSYDVQIIERNKIYNLRSDSNNPSSVIAGIDAYGVGVHLYNNMIALGNQVYLPYNISGIRLSCTGQPIVTSKVYNNSVYIGGTQLGSANTMALSYNGTYPTNMYNNILMNNRTNEAGSSGNHFSRYVGSSAPNSSIRPIFRHNLYFGTGVGYAITGGAGLTHATSDAGFFSNPHYIAPNAAIPDLYIKQNVETPVEGRGISPGFDVDIDNHPRSAQSPHDLGADAGDFLALQVPVITSMSIPTPFCAGGSATISGTSLGNVTELKIGNTIIPISQTVEIGTNNYILVIYPATAVSGLVSVTNLAGTGTSSTTVSVTAAPTITVQPANRSICSSESTTMSVTATNAGSYQWRRNGVVLTNNGVYSNATTATLTITNPPATEAGNFDVIAIGSPGACTTTSSQAILTVGGSPITLSASGAATQCAGGSVTLTPMISVDALTFDGVNDYFTMGNGSGYYDNMTMEFWMKTTQTGPPGTQWHQGNGIIDASEDSMAPYFGTSLLGNKLAFGINHPNSMTEDFTLMSNTAVNTGEWIHIVITRENSPSHIKMYINGILDNSSTAPVSGNLTAVNSTVGRLQTGGQYFAGSLDNIRTWNRILSPAEILASANETISQPFALVNNYTMEEGSGNATLNTVSNTVSTLLNGPQWTTRSTVANFEYYFWSNGANTPTITVNTTGNYSVTAFNGNCGSASSAIALVFENVNVGLEQASTTVCGNTPIPLTATGALTYTWTPATGLSATTGTSVMANPTVPTTYTVTGTSASGCTGSFEFTVNVLPNMPIYVTTSQSYILPGQVATLTASGNSDGFTWSPSSGLNTSFGNEVLASPTQTTTYMVTGGQCSTPQTVTVYVLPHPSLTDNALDFDGIDDFVSMPVQSNGVSGNFTVSVWVKPGHPTKAMHVFSSRNGDQGSTFDIQIKDGNRIHGDIGNGTSWLTTAADAIYPYQVNQWMHIAYVISPGQYKIFVNGNLAQIGTFPGTAVLYNNTSNFITLGKSESEDTYFRGAIDDLYISTFQLPLEIMQNAPRFGIPADARFLFDEGIAGGSNPTVTILAEANTQSTQHGTLYNFALNGPASNWVIGQHVVDQTISLAPANTVVYGTPYNPGAVASSNLPVTYISSDPSIATVSGNTINILNIGTVTIIAEQAGNAFYNNAMAFQTLTITPKEITIGNPVAQNKIYDRNTSAIITGTLNGILAPDIVIFSGTGTFASLNAGNGISVMSTSTLLGPDASKYLLIQPTGLSANITQKSITVSGAVANNKIYDGTTSATISGATLQGVIAPDAASITSNTGTFSSPNVGNNIAVTSQLVLGGSSAGNYSLIQPSGLSANITAQQLTATISGNATICVGQSTALTVTVNGTGPFIVMYTDGILIYTINNYTSGTPIQIAPVNTSTFTLVSVTNANATISVNGSAVVTVNAMEVYYLDADGDGFGNQFVPILACTSIPQGYVNNDTDCDDSDNTIHTAFYCYTDVDRDSFGTGTLVNICAVNATTPPVGYALNNTDCNDFNSLIYQSASLYVDADGDGYDAGMQTVCYGATVPAGFTLATLGDDCNDSDNTTHTTYPFYIDADGDGYGNGIQVLVCAVNAVTPPSGYSLTNTDCNDSDASAYQSAILFVDADFDGYTSGTSEMVCYGASIPAGYVAVSTAVDCNDTIAAVHPNATEIAYNGIDDDCDGLTDEGSVQITTTLLPSVCGTTLSSIGSLIGITTVNSTITGYRIKVTNGATVQIIERNVPHFTLPNLTSYDYATTYSVEIELQRNGIWLGYYGDACLVTSPAILASGGATQVSPSQCGITLPRLNTLIATTSLPGVTGYRFKVTNITAGASGPNVIQTIDRTLHWFNLPMLTQYNYGSTYRIEIAVKTNGAYSGYGSPCEVSSPPAPSLISCGGVVTMASTLVAATSMQNVTQYRFQVTRMSDNATTTIDRNINSFSFTMVPGYTPAAQYAVRVAVMTVGSWSPFGDACEITSPGSAGRFIPEVVTAPSDAFKAAAYPNPFASAFAIGITSPSSTPVEIRVYDMVGKLIELREVHFENLNTEKIGDRYPTGIYSVILRQDNFVKTLRVIKR